MHMLRLAVVPFLSALAMLLAPAALSAQTAGDVGRTAKDILTAPFRDTNLMKEKIPPLLEQASADPYSLAGVRNCAQFRNAVTALDQVLGADVDQLKPKEGQSVDEAALDVTEDLATGFIPFRGVIRRVSGAAAHEKKVRAAIYAGGLRRAYLKGMARGRGCRL